MWLSTCRAIPFPDISTLTLSLTDGLTGSVTHWISVEVTKSITQGVPAIVTSVDAAEFLKIHTNTSNEFLTNY